MAPFSPTLTPAMLPPIYMSDMTHLCMYLPYVSFMCVWHDAYAYVWRDLSHSYVRHDSFISRHITFICATWLIYKGNGFISSASYIGDAAPARCSHRQKAECTVEKKKYLQNILKIYLHNILTCLLRHLCMNVSGIQCTLLFMINSMHLIFYMI